MTHARAPLPFRSAVLLAALLCTRLGHATDNPEANTKNQVDLYGRFDGHLAFADSRVDFANNSSRFGIQAKLGVSELVTVFGHAEWKISLGAGDTQFNLSENPDTKLATIESTEKNPIGTRLSYIGLDVGEHLSLSVGKQWGAYYDVSRWTDIFTVFGSTGSGTYNAGTDGGPSGTGRADKAAVLRTALGPLALALQAQLPASRDDPIDWSSSLIYTTRFGLKVGLAYAANFYKVRDFDIEVVGFDGGADQALTGGLRFADAGWTIAAMNTWTKNHEILRLSEAAVVYDTLGAELFVGRALKERAMLYGGFDFAIPRGLDTRFVDTRFGTRDLIGGFRWWFDTSGSSYAYLEGRTGKSYDASGSRANDALMLGVRLNYSLRRALGLDS